MTEIDFIDPAGSDDNDPFADPAEYNPWAGPVQMERGRYRLPHPDTGEPTLFTRVSNVKSVLDDTYSLDRWRERTACKGLAMRPDLLKMAVATPLDERRTWADLVEKAKDHAGGNAGSFHGTAFHTLTEYADRGEPLPEGVDEALARQVEQYRIALGIIDARVIPHWIERVVWNRRYNIVGRTDRALNVDLDAIFELCPEAAGWTTARGRANVIGDVKSQKTMDFSNVAMAIQFADYAHADAMWDEKAGVWEDVDIELNQDIALVMHVPSNDERADLQVVNIARGWELLELAMTVRKTRNEKVNRFLVSVAETGWFNAIMNASTTDDLSSIWQQASARGEWNKALELYGLRRKAEIEKLAG